MNTNVKHQDWLNSLPDVEITYDMSIYIDRTETLLMFGEGSDGEEYYQEHHVDAESYPLKKGKDEKYIDVSKWEISDRDYRNKWIVRS